MPDKNAVNGGPSEAGSSGQPDHCDGSQNHENKDSLGLTKVNKKLDSHAWS